MKQLTSLLKRAVPSLLLLFCSAFAQAQVGSVSIKGSVVDNAGEPLIGASVVLKGNTGQGTVTDFDGNFQLKVPSESSVIVISYVGMNTQELKVGKQRTFKVTLTDNTKLTEVVVVGYGQQKKASVVGAITQTTGEVLERAGGVSNIGAALTGNLPGVVTMQSTGMPGDEDPKIVIRGISSWNSSDPLVLVDGIERSLGSIDIASVQSISVLKDASATAVYGVKGANGVILVTTKRGNDGKAKIEIGMQATAKVVSQLPGKLHSADALAVRNQAIEHELGLTPSSWGKITPEGILNKYRNPIDQAERERYPDVDWQDELFKKMAFSYNPNVNISGGTKAVKYFASVDFLHEGDLYREFDNNRGYNAGYGFNRINVRSNLDFQITKTTVLKSNLFGSHGQKKGLYGIDTGSWYESQLWQAAYSTPTDAFMPRYSDGTWGYYPDDTQGAHNSMQDIATGHGSATNTTTRVNTDFILEQDLSFITPGLRASATVSWDNVFVEVNRGINDMNHSTQTKWIDPETGLEKYSQPQDSKTNFDYHEGILWSTNGGSIQNWNTQRNLFYQGQLFWGRQFGQHDVTAMGVFNRTERTSGGNFTNYREDWAFRTTYNYGGRYFFEYNGAYNGSEKFSSANRFAFFNSGAVGYLISEEKFFQPLKKYIGMLKFRYSYGEVGDDYINSRWLYATQWAYGGNIQQGLQTETSPYTWYKESSVGNPDVHWEKAIKQNLGIDYSLLDGLFAGSIEIFHEKRSDILIAGANRSIPSYYGATPATANLGRVRTKGYELELRVNKVLHNGMRFWGNFNMTHAENKILEYDDAPGLPDYQKQTGFAIGQDHANLTSGYANTWDQVIGMTDFNTNDDQKLPGSYIIHDYNGDGVIDSNDSAPYSLTGTPQNTYSASIGWEWKGFSVYMQFYGVRNVVRYVAFNSLPGGKLDTVYDEGSYWTVDNMDADAPMPRWGSKPDYYEGTRFHYDGSFIRLKNAEIAYTFTQPWVKKMGAQSLKVFLNGNNLWVWSRMPDDRESNFAGTGLASQGAYPTVKRFNLGLKINL